MKTRQICGEFITPPDQNNRTLTQVSQVASLSSLTAINTAMNF